jgi:hypothetical protein
MSQQVFLSLDKDNSGFLSTAEIEDAFSGLSIGLSAIYLSAVCLSAACPSVSEKGWRRKIRKKRWNGEEE